jgi:dTDP-6-deoxy-L-talose 4-dehydrogenase (NAD+)
MRIAVTGASGFVGQYVLRELQARAMDILAVTRSAERLHVKSRLTGIVQMDIAQNIRNPYEQMGSPDILIHLAWGGLPNYQSTTHMEAELPAQLRFLKACVQSGLKRLVVSGTCFEYGKISGELIEDIPTFPCTEYGKAKDLLCRELQILQDRYVFELAWLRLFYLFGRGQSEQSLYSLLEAAISRGDRSFDMSEGNQLRDYLPAREAARLIVEVALCSGNTGIVNICSGAPVTVRRITESWIKERNATIILNFGKLPYSEIEPMSFWGSRKKLNAILATK